MEISIPGIGGSLGKCVVCGKSFALAIVTGEVCKFITVDGFDQDLPVHGECIDAIATAMESELWEDLPEGPLRQEFARKARQG